jgi:predicted permease
MSDLRDAYRSLRGAPIVSGVAILSLALGIGANTAIFSIVNSLLLRSLPVRDPHQLAIVTTARGNDSWTYAIWEQIGTRADLFDGAAAWARQRFNAARSGETQPVDGLMVSGGFFNLIGVKPILGRGIVPSDDRRGGGPDGPVAVISYSYWQRQFGGAVDAIGRPITLDRVTFTVVGVMPPEFFGPEVGNRFDVVVPFGDEPLIHGKDSALDRRSNWWLQILLRRKPGQDEAAARATLRGIQPQVRAATIPEHYRPQDVASYLSEPFVLAPAARGSSFLRERYERPLLTIMIVVALVLLIACANVANLLLARASARRHEMSVRLALGASRWQLARKLLVESLALSSVGTLLGFACARWGGRLLVAQLSTRTNTVYLDLALDWRVLGFTVAVAVGTAVLFGTAPAFRAARTEPSAAIKEHGRNVHGQSPLAAGNLLVVAQVALSLVLVVAAGLFVRTFAQLANRTLGFERDGVLVVRTELQNRALSEDERLHTFQRLREAALAIPGVASAAVSAVTPVSGSTWQFSIEPPDGTSMPERERSVYVNIISPDFFRTFGTRLLAGRDFSDGDQAESPQVVIVNETFARKFFGGRNPIGSRIKQTGFLGQPAKEREIVGYVEDAVYRNLRQDVPPTMYIPLTQQKNVNSAYMSISLRAASGSPALLTRAAADGFTRVTPDVSLTMQTLSEQVRNSLTQERLVAMLSGFFGALALLLAGIGLYGVTSYAVARRRTEIGIRMALGAQPIGVIGLVLRRVAVLVACGAAAGIVITVWASTFIATLLFQLQPRDPATLAIATALLGSIGAAAGGLPAWRASRIDPAHVLRDA